MALSDISRSESTVFLLQKSRINLGSAGQELNGCHVLTPSLKCHHFFLKYYSIKHRGSYMSAHVLLNLLNELGKRDKMRGFTFSQQV